MPTVTRVEMPEIFQGMVNKRSFPPKGFDKVTINDRTFKLGSNCGVGRGLDIHVHELASPEPEAKPIKGFWGAAGPGVWFKAGIGVWFQVRGLGNKGYIAKWDPDFNEWKIEQPQDTRLEMPSIHFAQDDVRMLTNALELMTFLHERNLKI